MRNPSLKGISLPDLQKELKRRQRSLPKLQKKRAKLLKQLNEVEGQIASLGLNGAGKLARGGPRSRPRNESPLPDMLAKVMSKSKAIKVSDLVQEVQKAGYKTTSDNFSTIVNQALIRDKRFKKSGRGMYLLA